MKYLIVIVLAMVLCPAAAMAQGQPIGKPGNGISYLAFIGATDSGLELTKMQVDKLNEMRRDVREVRKFRVDPNDDLATQQEKYRQNRERRKTIDEETSRKAYELLTPDQRLRAEQIRLQFNIQYGFYDALLEQLRISLDEDEREQLREVIPLTQVVAEAEARKLRRRLLDKAVKRIFGDDEFEKLVGAPFKFHQSNGYGNGERHRLPSEMVNAVLRSPKRESSGANPRR